MSKGRVGFGDSGMEGGTKNLKEASENVSRFWKQQLPNSASQS